MKKRILSILLCCVMLVGLLPTAALAAEPDVWDGSTKVPSGSGSESDPYLISTGEELAWLATLEAEKSYFVKLTNDIILNDGTFDQSGNFTKTGETAASTPHAWTPAKKAVWHIDGGNHYISGLYINSNDNDDVGLFSNLRGGSYVNNLTIKNSYVTASQSDKLRGVGVFAGQSSSDFTNCAGENNIVSANRYATGGIVGFSNGGSFNGVHTSGSISGSKALGGLVGWVFGDTVFKNCWNEASVTGGKNCGGIVGDGGNHSDCYNCANLGSGGITGSTGRTIKNCYILSEVESYGGAAKLLTTLNDNLYKMDGMSGLKMWVMGTGGYPLPTGEPFVDTTEYYDVWLDGVRVGARNQADILENGLASYNKDTKTLYLHDGLVVTNPYNKRLLYTEGDINLCVDGSVEFRSAQKVGSGPIVIDLGEVGGSGNLKIYAPTGKSAAVTVTCEQSEYGIDVRSLTLDGDVSLTVRTKDTPCFANCNTITLLSSEAVLDAENGDVDGRSMLNSVSKVILPSTNPQKLYEGIGAELDCVEQFTTQDDNGYDCMYPHIRIAPEVYALSDTLPKSLTVSMTEANTEVALSTWAAGQIRTGDITASNSEITVSDVVPAVAGSETNQSGTDGSFTVTVKLTKNGISKTTTIPGTITATAYTAPPHTHCICGGDTAVGDHTSHTNVTWTGVSSLSEITGTGSYYLTDDILMDRDLNITGTVDLCLNGHQIYTQTSGGRGTVKIQTGAALNVCDCSEDESGLITQCRGSYAIENSGTLNLYSGSVERSSDDNEAAVKVNAGAFFNMYGGKIGGNAKAILAYGTVHASGGTVSAKRQAMEVYAGSEVTVSGNAALSVTGTGYSTIAVYGGVVNIRGGKMTNDSSSAVYVPSGESTLNISGGEISTTSSAKADTIRLMSDSVEVTVTGGSITNGYASAATNTEGNRYGWAIDVYKVKSLTISGAPVINRIYLADSYRITVGEGGLTYETPIEIHCAKCPAPVTGANDTDYGSKFTPRSNIYAIINAKGNVVLFTRAAIVTYTDGVDNEVIFPDQTHNTYLGQPTPVFNGTPQRPGYVFGGWYTDRGCTDGNEYDFDTPVTGNITLYAKWSSHTHSWATEWNKNETHHWHECTADGCDVTNDTDKDDYGAHVYDNDTDTTCNTCGYERTITPSHTHSWAEDWSKNETHHWHECTADGCDVTNVADKDDYGAHVYDNDADTDCNTCGYIRTVEPPAHTHSWATAWSNDETYHWHNCTAEGCDVTENSGKYGYGAHVYDNDTDTTCNTCGYIRTVTPSHTHSWAEDWSRSETHHWHECTAEGCDVTENSEKNGYGAHDYTDDTDTDCNTCGYERTISGGGGGTHYPAYHGPVQPALVLPPKTGDITFFGWLRALLGVD